MKLSALTENIGEPCNQCGKPSVGTSALCKECMEKWQREAEAEMDANFNDPDYVRITDSPPPKNTGHTPRDV